MQAWTGTCHLRALTPDAQDGIGDLTEAQGCLMLQAATKEAYVNGVTRAANAAGYQLESIRDVKPAAQMRQDRTMAGFIDRAMPQLCADRPVVVGDFQPAGAHIAHSETSWDDLLVPNTTPLWAVVDGVSWPEISAILPVSGVEHCCLYSTLDPQARAMAPWLVRVLAGHPLTQTLKARAQSDHSMILLQSSQSMDDLRRHLRRFTMVWTPADTQAPIYFRFYDPRVLIDALECLPLDLLGRFLAPFSGVVSPITPLCLLPDRATVTPGIDRFAALGSTQGRLLMSAPAGTFPTAPVGNVAIPKPAFDAMGKRTEIRAQRALARLLFDAHGTAVAAEECVTVSEVAQENAAKFGLNSVKQIRVMARALLLFGPVFWDRHPDAARILRDTTIPAWQKKDRLAKWLATAILSPDPSNPSRLERPV